MERGTKAPVNCPVVHLLAAEALHGQPCTFISALNCPVLPGDNSSLLGPKPQQVLASKICLRGFMLVLMSPGLAAHPAPGTPRSTTYQAGTTGRKTGNSDVPKHQRCPAGFLIAKPCALPSLSSCCGMPKEHRT